MPRTERRTGRQPAPGSRFLSQVLAENIKAWRGWNHLSQGELADRMNTLGHRWSHATVSAVETWQRTVSVDELWGLAAVLGVAVPDLLDPANRAEEVDFGGIIPVPARVASWWMRGRVILRLEGRDHKGNLTNDWTLRRVEGHDDAFNEARMETAKKGAGRWVEAMESRHQEPEEGGRREGPDS
ncbi:MAG TPA: helix-turn-helix transcriptional regulator [Actinomycetota bacterium]|nr:helix-turn-helix transcriptional regulator [Actinomycetota bacterium]